MATLTTKQRNRLKPKSFVFPKSRSYPINDINHGRAALSMVARFGSPAEVAKVRAAVYKKYPILKNNK